MVVACGGDLVVGRDERLHHLQQGSGEEGKGLRRDPPSFLCTSERKSLLRQPHNKADLVGFPVWSALEG